MTSQPVDERVEQARKVQQVRVFVCDSRSLSGLYNR